MKDGNGNGIGDGEFLFGIEWSWSLLSGLKSVISNCRDERMALA